LPSTDISKTEQINDLFVAGLDANQAAFDESLKYNRFQRREASSKLIEDEMSKEKYQDFPNAIIIGFRKCGTRALLNFLLHHPNVVTSKIEQHFYDVDSNFAKGYQWYKSLQPFKSKNQIILEKTPAYVRSERARREISNRFPNTKLIAVVRDPVDRLVSDYEQVRENNPETPPVWEYYKDSDGEVNSNKTAIRVGMYYEYLSRWYATFPKSQILVIDSKTFIKNPLPILKATEMFLNIPKYLTVNHMFYNQTKGFYCYINKSGEPHCLQGGKGRPHTRLPEAERRQLYDFYKPYNEALFHLTGKRYDWTMKP